MTAHLKASVASRAIWIATTSVFIAGAIAIALDFLWWIPFNLVTVVPAVLVGLALGETGIAWAIGAAAGGMIGAAIFFLLTRQALRAGPTYTRRSLIAFFALFGISAILAVIGWDDTIRFTSENRANSLVFQSMAPPLVVLGLGVLWRRNLSADRILILHWVGGLWLAWSAMPWYGELL